MSATGGSEAGGTAAVKAKMASNFCSSTGRRVAAEQPVVCTSANYGSKGVRWHCGINFTCEKTTASCEKGAAAQ